MSDFDRSFLDIDSPADREVRILAAADEPDIVIVEIDTMPGGTVRLRMGLDDCKKLACRLYGTAKRLGGEVTSGRPAGTIN